jgi:hypothetical protein
MAIREGRATPENAVAVVSPGEVLGAWKGLGELPPEVLRGVECLRRGEVAEGCALLFAGEVDAAEIAKHFAALRNSDPEMEAPHIYAQLAAKSPDAPQGRQMRAYLPKVPDAARWAWERYHALGRTERGTTLRSEISAELREMWGITDRALMREHAGYIEAMDSGFGEHRAVIEGNRADGLKK